MRQFIMLILIGISCSSPSAVKEKEVSESSSKSVQESQLEEKQTISSEDYQYKLVLRHVDNRVIIFINDSTIYDTGDLPGGPYEREIDLTNYVKNQRTNLKIELHNSNPPDETMRPGWMIVYDIFVNEELAEFVSEKKNESKEGVVFTESYDLTEIW